jgi:hypothetical protein
MSEENKEVSQSSEAAVVEAPGAVSVASASEKGNAGNGPTSRMRTILARTRLFLGFAWPLATGAALLMGLLYLGAILEQRVRKEGKNTIAFSELDLPAPPGSSLPEFLEETQYLAKLPDRLDLVDTETPSRLANGLAQHPWVSKVQQVRLISRGKMKIDLEYRVAALVVVSEDRVVDREGVLLPRSAPQTGLLLLSDAVPRPKGLPGKPWGDPIVSDAAAVAGWLLPCREKLSLNAAKVSIVNGEVIIDAATRKLLWGRPPGKEGKNESTAQEKIHRLQNEKPPQAGTQWDLRPKPNFTPPL